MRSRMHSRCQLPAAAMQISCEKTSTHQAAMPTCACMPLGLQELRDFVKQLLVRKPAYRLGQGSGGTADIKRHAWFASFDWEAFAAKKLKAPYMPVVR